MWKLLSLSFSLLFILAPVAGGFGTVVLDDDESVDDLEGSYRIGLINNGNTTRDIDLSAVTGGNVSVKFDRASFSLLPSRSSDEPVGDGWLYTGETYVEPAYVAVRASIDPDTVQREHTFHIDVTASVPSDGAGPSVAQERRHTFTISSSSPRLEPEDDESGGDVFDIIGGESGDSGDRSEQQEEAAGDEDAGGDGQQKNITGDTAAPTGEGGTGPVTVLLVAAITVTVASILWELL